MDQATAAQDDTERPGSVTRVSGRGNAGHLCPFLDTSGKNRYVCRSRIDDEVVIGDRYVEQYCRTDAHHDCTLYRTADGPPQTQIATDTDPGSGGVPAPAQPPGPEAAPVREAAPVDGKPASRPTPGPEATEHQSGRQSPEWPPVALRPTKSPSATVLPLEPFHEWAKAVDVEQGAQLVEAQPVRERSADKPSHSLKAADTRRAAPPFAYTEPEPATQEIELSPAQSDVSPADPNGRAADGTATDPSFPRVPGDPTSALDASTESEPEGERWPGMRPSAVRRPPPPADSEPALSRSMPKSQPIDHPTESSGKRVRLAHAGQVVAFALVLVCVLLAFVLARSFFSPDASHHRDAGRSAVQTQSIVSRESHGTHHPVTQVTAARSWHFPALNGPAHDGLLLLFNPNRVPLEVTIATPGGTDLERADIGAQKSAEADLIGLNSMRALQVRATAPIVAHRMVVRHGALQAAPGQTGQ